MRYLLIPLTLASLLGAATASAQPASSQSQPGHASPSAETDDSNGLPPFSVVVRGGMIIEGSGDDRLECDGSDCPPNFDYDADFDHKTAFMLGADFLFTAGSIVRLGPGFQIGNNMVVELQRTKEEVEVGSDVSVHFALEGDYPMGDGVWVGPRVQLGLGILRTSGDMKDFLEASKESCESKGQNDCDSFDGPYPGGNFGMGAGVIAAVGESVRLRADLMIQSYLFMLYSWDADDSDATVTEKFLGTRVYAMGGVEF